METTVKQRLKEHLDETGVTVNKLSTLIKMPQKTLNNQINGDSDVSITTIVAISDWYNISLEWLLTGVGKKEKNSFKSVKESNYLAKPFIEAAYAECGKPGGFSLCVKRDDCELLSIPFVKDYDFSITATGDSMINRTDVRRSILSGDIVACKIVNSRTHVRFGEVYALSTLDGFTIKKVVPSDKEGCIKCVPFNTEDNFYEFDMPVEEIFDWAFVVSVVRINKW